MLTAPQGSHFRALDTFAADRIPYSACPPQRPADAPPGEDVPAVACVACRDHGVMWQSHERPWTPCGYCDRGRDFLREFLRHDDRPERPDSMSIDEGEARLLLSHLSSRINERMTRTLYARLYRFVSGEAPRTPPGGETA